MYVDVYIYICIIHVYIYIYTEMQLAHLCILLFSFRKLRSTDPRWLVLWLDCDREGEAIAFEVSRAATSSTIS